MPYPNGNAPRRVPVAREVVSTEFQRADGQVDGHTHFAKVVGPSPAADVDAQVLQRKVELACGCYSPDAEVAGVCQTCAAAGVTANVCKAHFAICACGASCCWRHSRPVENSPQRICERCNLQRKNDARLHSAGELVKSIGRTIFGRPSNGTEATP